MDRIWAPWRIQYILGERPPEAEPGCIFCVKPKSPDMKKELVLLTGEKTFALMNLYPYNSGHLMIAPYEHAGCLTLLPDDTLAEIMTMTKRLIPAMRDALHPDGFNMGFNIGRVAGAGFDDHAHFHIVPRWNGDANFMPALGDTKVIGEHIEATYDRLRAALEKSAGVRRKKPNRARK